MEGSLLEFIASFWSLAKIEGYQELKGGCQESLLWHLKSSGSSDQLVARITPHPAPNVHNDFLPTQIAILHYLRSQGLPVIEYVGNKCGEFNASTGEIYRVSLYHYVSGKHLTSPPLVRDDWQVESVGHFCGQLSVVGARYLEDNAGISAALPPKPFLSAQRIIDDLESITPEGILYSDVDFQRKELLVNQIKKMREYAVGIDWSPLNNTLPCGILHSDLHDQNLLFHSTDHAIAGVIDWDDMSIGPLVMDLAMALANWCFLPNGDWNPKMYQLLLASYQQHRTISPQETELLFPLVILCGLHYFAFHYLHAEWEAEVRFLLDFTDQYYRLWERGRLVE